MELYNKISEIYDILYSHEQIPKYLLIIKLLKHHNVSSLKILDLGSGTALFFEYLLRYFGNNVHYVGVDISKNMLKKAVQKYKRYRALIDVIIADYNYLPLRLNYFNVITSITSICTTRSLLNIVNEIKKYSFQGIGIFTYMKNRIDKCQQPPLLSLINDLEKECVYLIKI